jgi:hypothetical protein
MKYIDDSNDVVKPQVDEVNINKLGVTTENKNDRTFAKIYNTTTPNGEVLTKYYVLTFNNVPYDPYGIDSHREKNLNTKLRSTSKQVFDDYIVYLKTKNRLYMTRTQRNFIHV